MRPTWIAVPGDAAELLHATRDHGYEEILPRRPASLQDPPGGASASGSTYGTSAPLIFSGRKTRQLGYFMAVRPAQPVDVGVGDYRREGGHGADHGRRREPDHPVSAHRLAPRRAAAAEPLDADRGRISELSRKQQG